MHHVRRTAILCLTIAVVVWNVVFDRILAIEGREYVYAAAAAASQSSDYVLAEPWMRAAQQRGLWVATAAALLVLSIGFGWIVIAVRGRGRGDRAD